MLYLFTEMKVFSIPVRGRKQWSFNPKACMSRQPSTCRPLVHSKFRKAGLIRRMPWPTENPLRVTSSCRDIVLDIPFYFFEI